MDEILVNYIKSGQAWVLIGSGLSTANGYPNWRILAQHAIDLIKLEQAGYSLDKLESSLRQGDYPQVFEEASNASGAPRFLEYLDSKLKPTKNGRVYDLIARWPIPVYLTTNYDNEIQKSLTKVNQAYIPYLNSEDDLGHLNPDLQGGIFKLHGDLRSEKGLILTTSQYQKIQNSPEWDYWRIKLVSVFQMMQVVIIGHSLSDPSIKHLLEMAKKGAGIARPICWIAPDVPIDQRKTYLETFKIRIIPYDNSDGEHKNLVKLIENISDFIPPRETVQITRQIADVINSPLNQSTAASAFFIFNKLAEIEDLDERRFEIILAAIQAILPELSRRKTFNFDEVLELIGWPEELRKQHKLVTEIQRRCLITLQNE